MSRVFAAVVLSLLAGCKRAEEPAVAPGQRTLTFFSALTQVEWNVLRQEVFPAFERAHDCRIVGVDVASSEMVRKLSALSQAGRMTVDLIGQDNMALALLVQNGLVEDLSAHERMLPEQTLKQLIEVGRFDGKLYFLPYRPNVEVTFYNRRYFEKHGLRPPTDWDELKEVAKTFYEREGVGRVAIKADSTTVHLIDFIHAAGGDPLVLNDEGSARAFTYLRELWPYLSPESRRADSNTMNQFLAMESVYLAQNWSFAIQVIVRQGEKEDILGYHGWRGPVREAHTLGGELFAIPKGAPNRALALEFIRYVHSVPVQATLMRKLAWPSMRSDAYAEVEAWQRPYFQAVQEALAHAIARPSVTYWETVDKSIGNAFREAVVERRDLKATLDKYAAVIAAARARANENNR